MTARTSPVESGHSKRVREARYRLRMTVGDVEVREVEVIELPLWFAVRRIVMVPSGTSDECRRLAIEHVDSADERAAVGA